MSSLNNLQLWMEAFERSRMPAVQLNEVVEEVSNEVEIENEIEIEIEIESESKEIDDEGIREENFKRNLEVEKQKVEKKRLKLQEEQKVREAEIEIEIEERRQEEKRRRKIEKREKGKTRRNRKILEGFWDFNMQELVQGVRSDGLEAGFRIFGLLRSFHQAAVQAAELLIADLQLPSSSRRVSQLSESRFIYNNLLLHLAYEEDPPARFKTLGHEFRAMQLLHEAIFFLAKDSDFPIRVPLTALVDLQGFRVLAVSIVPLDSHLTIVHGLKDPDYFLSDPTLYSHLSSISQLLNIKEQNFEWQSGFIPVMHLSVFCQVHLSLGYNEIEDLEGHCEDNQYFYLTQTADILPLDLDFNQLPSDYTRRIRPEFFTEYALALSSNACINLTETAIEEDDYELCEAGLKVRTDKIGEIVELLDSLSILPIDSKSFTQALHANGVNCRYIGLVAQRTKLTHVKDLCLVEIVARTCKRIYYQQLVDLAFDSEDLSGDNFGASRSGKFDQGNKFYKEKKETFDFIGENISNIEFRKHAFLKRIENQLRWPNYKELKAKLKPISLTSPVSPIESSLKDGIIDYLNLVFGSGEESSIFWEEILLKKAASHFSIPLEKLNKSQINLQALLHSICFHCGLSINFSKQTLLGRTENPFTLKSFQALKAKSKCVKLEGLENSVVQETIKDFEAQDQVLETSLMMLKISKLLNIDPEFLGDSVLLAQTAEILLEKNEFEAAIQHAKDALMQIHPLHAEGVKSWCVLIRAMMASAMQDEALQSFDQALTALEYHWGPYHPLHCTLYSILAYLYMEKGKFDDALILYKNSIVCSLRVLGPNHPNTAEAYIELGTLYVKQRNLEEAVGNIEKGFLVYENNLGKFASATLNTAAKLALLYLEIADLDKVKGFVERLVLGYEKVVLGLVEREDVDVDRVQSAIMKWDEGFDFAEKYLKSVEDDKFERTVRKKRKGMKKIKERFV